MKLLDHIRSLFAQAIVALRRFLHQSAPAAPPPKPRPQQNHPPPPPIAVRPRPPEQEDDPNPDRPPSDFSLLPEPILAIDLGAWYTKVSFRPRILPGRPFTEESQELTLDGTALIPTVVLRDPVGTWHFGSVAANLKAAAAWQVWLNWKKDLLDSGDAPDFALTVATRFFAWLRENLQPLLPDLHRTRVRIALPALDNFPRNAQVLRDCMARAGWNPGLIKPVREPQANIIGLTSRGRNHVTWSAAATTPYLNYARMFGHLGIVERAINDYINRARTSKFLKGLVVDIGAYTTDIAPLIIDLTAEISEYGDGIEALNPASVRLGISAQLDQPLFQTILPDSQPDRSQLSFAEFELLKRDLYAGKTYSTASGLDLGTKDHQQIIDSHLEHFADALWTRLNPAAAEHRPEWIAFTGGGSCIAPLSQKIRRRVEDAGFKVAALGESVAQQPADTHGPAAFSTWSETGVELKRLATALGATNPVLDVPSTSPCHTHRDWLAAQAAERPQPPPRQSSCRCGGLNPDCSECDGTGSIPTDRYAAT